jgi:predicted dehydrogenase
MDADARLRVFDKGAERLDPDSYGAWQYKLRDGSMYVPRLEMTEPLAEELRHFLACARTGDRPRTDGWNGVAVVAVLEAVDESLRQRGLEVPVQLPAGAVR